MNPSTQNRVTDLNRRDILRIGVAGLGTVLGASALSGCASSGRRAGIAGRRWRATDRVRVGIVGVGGRGQAHVRELLSLEGVEIRAVCDIVEDKVALVQKMVVDAGQSRPTGYDRGPTDFRRMCEREELDIVYNATPWQWHAPIAVASMENGKHAAPEVPAAMTIEECWQLVETSERTGQHCIMLENCCYGQSELMVLNMVRRGLFGELLHGECGYLHDLRDIKFSDHGEGLWRLDHSIHHDGNPYPTHGLGPIAQYMNVNRGDCFDYLVSMSSKSRGLNLYAAEKYGPDDPRATRKYALGDINSTLIRTINGCTIIVMHDCSSPRPYSRINMIQGTKGLFEGYPDRIHIEGRSPAHAWEDADAYRAEFDHPLWTALAEKARTSGHGGMDYVMNHRLIHCLQTGTPPDMDVYDAASWSVITELSERSVARRSAPQDVPDFTRGAWKTTSPLGIVTV